MGKFNQGRYLCQGRCGFRQVASLVAEIAVASNEQAQGIDQVNNAVAEIDKVIQRKIEGIACTAGPGRKTRRGHPHG